MPFSFPDLPALRQQARAWFTARLPGADARTRRNSVQVSADLNAATTWLQYRYLTYLAEQLFTDTAESSYLERMGAPFGIARPAAAPAAGPAVFSGQIGISVPVGSQVSSQDGTVQYLVQTGGEIGANGEVSLPILATTPGTAGNFDAGAPLVLQTAIAGVLPDVVVDTAGLIGGTEAGTDDQLRALIYARKSQPPQGGAAPDYVTWAKQVAGVTRVWVYPDGRGAGTVDVAFVMDERADIIPLAADVAAVQAVLQVRRPVTADVLAFAPLAVPVAVKLSLLSPDTPATRAAIATQLTGLFAVATPGGAVYGDGVSTVMPGGTTYLEAISASIAASPGVDDFDLQLPAADVVMPRGSLAVLGPVLVP